MAISTQRLVVVAAAAIVTAVPSTGQAFNTLTTELVTAGLPQPVFVTAG